MYNTTPRAFAKHNSINPQVYNWYDRFFGVHCESIVAQLVNGKGSRVNQYIYFQHDLAALAVTSPKISSGSD